MRYKRFAMLGLSAAVVVSLVLVARLARAAVFIQQDIPISITGFDSCTGEDILVSGTAHEVGAATLDNAGGAHIVAHVNFQDVSGVGLTSGTVYHATAATTIEADLTNGAQEATMTVDERFVAPGGNNNLFLHATLHTTINADGTVTSVVDNVTTGCQ